MIPGARRRWQALKMFDYQELTPLSVTEVAGTGNLRWIGFGLGGFPDSSLAANFRWRTALVQTY